MTPEHLKRLNLEHFTRLLERTSDPEERARIQRLMEEERLKSQDAYPDSGHMKLR